MCLALPAQLIERNGDRGLVDRGGLRMEVDLALLPEAKPGDHIVIHVGIGLAILTAEEAQATHAAFAEINERNERNETSEQQRPERQRI